jgi:hypothetical protein
MGGRDGWGRAQGREVLQKLIAYVETQPEQSVLKLSMKGVGRIDVSFASEAIVELVRRYRSTRGVCLVDIEDDNLLENLDAAADRADVPVAVWQQRTVRMIGPKPSAGNREALEFALRRSQARAAELAETADISIANASTKFKQLWEQGFLLRSEAAADSGGVEFLYQRIG